MAASGICAAIALLAVVNNRALTLTVKRSANRYFAPMTSAAVCADSRAPSASRAKPSPGGSKKGSRVGRPLPATRGSRRPRAGVRRVVVIRAEGRPENAGFGLRSVARPVKSSLLWSETEARRPAAVYGKQLLTGIGRLSARRTTGRRTQRRCPDRSRWQWARSRARRRTSSGGT
jgi:hypothetical protein